MAMRLRVHSVFRTLKINFNLPRSISTSAYLLQKSDSDAPSNGIETISAKVIPKIKTSFTYDGSVKSNKFISPLRAIREFILTAKDLDTLPSHYSRSPYSNETRTKVYMRSDVEQLAYEKHGGRVSFEIRRKIIKDMERRANAEVFNLKKAIKYFKSSAEKRPSVTPVYVGPSFHKSGAGRVVLFAITINALNVAAKSFAWWYTGSKSMFSEVMHSIADTLNQLLVAYGLYSSLQKPDEEHPYGYVPMRNVSSLISGVAIFFLGAGLTGYHGIQGILQPKDIESLYVALFVMAGSLLSEGSTLALAYREAKRSARQRNYESVRQWLLAGVDPSTGVVFLEDLAAVLGVIVAGSAMAISAWTNSPIPDALGAVGVSMILATVAALIIHVNTDMLIGRAIPMDKQEGIMRIIDNAKVIRGTYDIKTTVVGGDEVRFKAEVDIDGQELTKRYLETLPMEAVLKELQGIKTEEQMVYFMLKHGENIVNTLGAEINQIEDTIKKEYPDVKHIDIEIN